MTRAKSLTHSRRARSVVATVLGTALVTAAVATGLVIHGRASVRIEAAGPILVTGDDGAQATIEAHSTPDAAVDPADLRHLVLADRIDRPGFGCEVHVSTDAGAHWKRSVVPLPPKYFTCFAPDVAFANGSVLLVYLTLNVHPKDPLSAGNDPNGTWVLRSTDGGYTFGTPTQVPGTDNLQPRLAVDPKSNRIYLVYVSGGPLQNETPLGFGPPPNPIMVTSSTDGGQSFAPPVQVNDPARLRVAAPVPVVGPSGTLFVLYEDYKDDLNDYNNRASAYQGTFALVLARSSDAGRTFTQIPVDNSQVRPYPFLIYLPPFPTLAVAPDGQHLYAAWSDARDGAPDILMRRSADGGDTWSDPVKLDVRTREPASYELPALAAPTTGQVDAIFYGLVGTQTHASVLATASNDGGVSFSTPIDVSAAFDATVGVPSLRYPGSIDLGSHPALLSLGGGDLIAAWNDSTLGTPDTGRQDIFTARVTVDR